MPIENKEIYTVLLKEQCYTGKENRLIHVSKEDIELPNMFYPDGYEVLEKFRAFIDENRLADSKYKIIGVVVGEFETEEGFKKQFYWQIQCNQEYEIEQQRARDEMQKELEWQQYVAENWDEERCDWKC